MMGNVVNLFLKPARKQPMLPVADVSAVEGGGLTGDVSFGSSKRQVLMVESEVLGRHALLPGSVRENITTSGIRLSGVPAGTRLRLGETVLEVTGDCTPCSFMDTLRPGLQERIAGERGLVARVITSGTIKIGDPITIEDRS
jgi:MOSC domain-containing protein YiiM